MEVDCEGCAGCCIDWRPLADGALDHERRGPYEPLDDAYSLVSLRREEIRRFVEGGQGDALTPRLWTGDGDSVTVGGVELAAIDRRPTFLIGLRHVPKPVGPFGAEPTWLSTCVFLDPDSLQCRIHDAESYPETCQTYPGSNLLLGAETECERVEREHGGHRLLDTEAPPDAEPMLGPGAVGTRVFAHPEPDRIEAAVARIRDGEATARDRAEFVAVAAAASPGTVEIEESYYERTRERIQTTDSWVGGAIDDWQRRARTETADPALAESIEAPRGAPQPAGWEGTTE
ncbi:YkgJ family cysteine cluster protein [Halorhabdus sp. CUG00001]|uniref:YkgJ family cysteine cluster protein n=1 Tax=Halorhabdus sp. CUG00001 TaxID=2600297 RepID=UPI00131D0AEB|nr:YkgJ family cysteine cluster protein [Halorhabdus sp. CUG00001]